MNDWLLRDDGTDERGDSGADTVSAPMTAASLGPEEGPEGPEADGTKVCGVQFHSALGSRFISPPRTSRPVTKKKKIADRRHSEAGGIALLTTQVSRRRYPEARRPSTYYVHVLRVTCYVVHGSWVRQPRQSWAGLRRTSQDLAGLGWVF